MQKMLVKNNEKRDISLILCIIYCSYLVFKVFIQKGIAITNNDVLRYMYFFRIDKFLKFEIDKHEVFIGLVSNQKNMTLSYIVMVDGQIQTTEKEWVHIVEKAKFSKKYIKTCDNMYGKKYCEERGFYDKYSYTLPCFPSFSALRKMLKKHNEVIFSGKNASIILFRRK